MKNIIPATLIFTALLMSCNSKNSDNATNDKTETIVENKTETNSDP